MDITEKKFERAQQFLKSASSLKPSSSDVSNSSIRSAIQELDSIVREIVGADVFYTLQQQFNNILKSDDEMACDDGDLQSSSPPPRQSPCKKTRQNSPDRVIPHGLSALDIFSTNQRRLSSPKSSFNQDLDTAIASPSLSPIRRNQRLSPSSRSFGLFQGCPGSSSAALQAKEMEWERLMWDSATLLSNSRPSPTFTVQRSERARREEKLHHSGDVEMNLKSDPDEPKVENIIDDELMEDTNLSLSPLFEGGIANATPGDPDEGGTGEGTAQHLACLLDSPLALAILIVFGVNVDARHTAFRRLAMHEAACADSPNCLGLLMEVGARYSREWLAERSKNKDGVAAASSSFEEHAESSTLTVGSFFDGGDDDSKKIGKMKLKIFSGWNVSKADGGSGTSGRRKSLQLRRTSLDVPGGGDESSTIDRCTSFPTSLKVIWEAIQLVRSGDMSEIVAAQHILDQVSASGKTKKALALQCPHLSSNVDEIGTEQTIASSFSPFPGYESFVAAASPDQRFRSTPPVLRRYNHNNIDGHGNTPLHWAAFKNSIRAMDVLLAHNVDVNSRAQPSGWTPLHDGAYSDSAEAVARLLNAGAQVDARSHSGATPLCFSAQEDAPNATRLLLEAGADPSKRCLGQSPGIHLRANNADNHIFHSRFSGYTPLHYCAHYNSAKAARVLLYHGSGLCPVQFTGGDLLEIPDLNDKLPIHVAVARGSSEVLRELLHGGARVETACYHPPSSSRVRTRTVTEATASIPLSIPTNNAASTETESTNVVTPVSSPVLRSLIPAQPISSTKPWNCLSQKAIDACRSLIEEVEQNWTPARHALFSPTDRLAVKEVLKVGKRMEQDGVFIEVWPFVLSFCGRGWFEKVEGEDEGDVAATKRVVGDEERGPCIEEEMQCSSSSSESSEDEFTQFQLDGALDGTSFAAVL